MPIREVRQKICNIPPFRFSFLSNFFSIFLKVTKSSLRLIHVEGKTLLKSDKEMGRKGPSGIWIHTRRFLPLKQPNRRFWLASFRPASEYPEMRRPNPSSR